MARKQTVFQALDAAISGNWEKNGDNTMKPNHVNSYDMSAYKDKVLYRTTNKDDYEQKKLELRQDKWLKDRWVKANVDLSVTAYNGLNNIKLMYRDADLMDAFPEIGAALDTYAEESCLVGSTKIKLLNGSTKTIEDLYNENYKDFWVYSVDKDGKCKPSKVEGVLYKGVKSLYKIILDDGTEIKCTGDHRWMLSDGTWVETNNLSEGMSLMSIYKKYDYKGYEKIKSTTEDKFKHTHRIVAESVLRDEKQALVDKNKPYQLIVIHHKSFDKLNNDPSELEYMYWDEHQKLHTDLNSKRWENAEFSKKMSTIFSETAKAMWKDADMAKRLREKHSLALREKMASMTPEERQETFGRRGNQNGMYGIHRFGDKNPNYDRTKNRYNDIDLNEYVDFFVNNKVSSKILCKKFNINIKTLRQINSKLCNMYNLSDIRLLKYKKLNDTFLSLIEDFVLNKKNITLSILSKSFGQNTETVRKFLKNNNLDILKINEEINSHKIDEICDYLIRSKNRSFINAISEEYNLTHKKSLKIAKEICKKYGIKSILELIYVYKRGERLSIIKEKIQNSPLLSKAEIGNLIGLSPHELLVFVKKCGYKNYLDFRSASFNHRVAHVEKLDESGDVYDLLNSSVNYCYGVECNDGLIISHNCVLGQDGSLINVYSKSSRIKSILEDLFVNRLNIHLTAPMVIRAMCKYGNQFMLLDVDHKNGVKGWKQLPVFNVERVENGIRTPYAGGQSIAVNSTSSNPDDTSTQFVWLDGDNSQVPFRDWQVAHFRLLTNSLYLPYGVSILNAARRHWRMLSLMEDMMLIYRLERSMERRIYKIFVGNIDDADVKAYVEQVANEFKRTPIIDPITGQLDLRKNVLAVDNDIFIPVRDENAATPIDTLSAGQNLTAMDDIKFVQNKLFTALRVPKSFLNFEENAGDGKNLALMDVRFTRMVNRVQQAFLMELTKVAMIHLYLLGFKDELTNFTLSMNNPSTQAEQLEIENLQKKIDAVRDAVSDPGNGIPVISWIHAMKMVFKMSDSEIQEILEEIRLEKGISAELEKTPQIIKRTGLFDKVDRVYGEPGAKYVEDQQGGAGGMDDGMGGGGMPPMGGGGGPTDFGEDLDGLGAPGAEEGGDIGGAAGSVPTQDMPGGESQPPMESALNGKKLVDDNKVFDALVESYRKDKTKATKLNESMTKTADIYDKDALLINEDFEHMIDELGKFVVDNKETKKKKKV